MTVSKTQVLEALQRVKGPDLQSNIVELGLVSEILIKDGRVYFSITVPASKAEELEPLRQAAQKVVEDIAGVSGATAVLTAEAPRGPHRHPSPMAGRLSTRVSRKHGRGARRATARRVQKRVRVCPV